MRLLGIFFVLVLFSSCKKETPVLFTMPLQNLDFVMPAGQNAIETYYFNFPAVPTNIHVLLDNFGYAMSDVSGIVPGEGRLTPIFSDGNYEDLFREFVVQICTTGSTGNKCGVEGFYWDLVGQKVSFNLDVIPNPIDVSDFLTEETVHIQVWYRLLRTSNETIESRLSLDFLVQ